MQTSRTTFMTRWIAATCFTALLSACGGGGSDTAASTGNVGPEGAVVTSDDHMATLSVPAGAVSSRINVTLQAASSGFTTSPLIVAGSTYLLDSPDTDLASAATLSITVPAGALPAAKVARNDRKHALAGLSYDDLVGCDTPIVSGQPLAAGTRCYFIAPKFDDPGGPGTGPVLGYCGDEYRPVALGATVNVGKAFALNVQAQDGSLYTGFFQVCEVPPAPAPQIADVSLAAPGLFASIFDAHTGTVTAQVSHLFQGVMGVLLDTQAPVVTMSASVVSDGNGNAHYVVSGTAIDNIGVKQVVLSRIDGINPQTLAITLTPLAQLTPGAYSYTSPVMPLASIQDQALAVRATDSAGNIGAQWVLLNTALPTLTAFSASPATVNPGSVVTLSWSAANEATLTLDHGIGDVTGLSSKSVTVNAATTYTLTATNPNGSVTATTSVAVGSTVNRYVDPVNGSDANACAQAAPCKTINKAMTGAPANAAVYLVDGSYPTESVTIPDGVALRASNPGLATLKNVTLAAAGSASLNGLVFDQTVAGCSSITAVSAVGAPTLGLTGVLFKCGGGVNLGGKVQAVMTPGLLAGGVYTAFSVAPAPIVNLTGTAQLQVQGGIFDFNNFGQGAYGPGRMNAAGSSLLVLDGVTVRNLREQAVVLSGNGSATLRNQTLIDHVGDAGFCAPGAALVMTGTGTLTLDHATVSNGPNAAICVGSGGTDVPTVTITQSTISNMAGAAIASNTGVSADAKITANGLTLSGNGRGIDWTSSSAASSLDLSNLTVTGNTYNGITVSNGSLRLRSSTVSGNGQEGGVVLRGSAIAGTFDLGTSASPGGNTFVGNTGPGLNSVVDAGVTVHAVGNTWKASTQGADANGRYSTAPAYAPVIKSGATAGANFNIGNPSTLEL